MARKISIICEKSPKGIIKAVVAVDILIFDHYFKLQIVRLNEVLNHFSYISLYAFIPCIIMYKEPRTELSREVPELFLQITEQIDTY